MRSSSTLSFSPYHCSLGLVAGELLASEDNVGARSDLLRLEVRLTSHVTCPAVCQVLYRFGGIYLDTDSHSLSGFTPFFQKSFVSYTFDPWWYTNNLQTSLTNFPGMTWPTLSLASRSLLILSNSSWRAQSSALPSRALRTIQFLTDTDRSSSLLCLWVSQCLGLVLVIEAQFRFTTMTRVSGWSARIT